MENDRGDLADVVGASGSCCSGGNASNPAMDWQLPSGPINVPSEAEEPVNSFGDPFSNIRDPLLHELQLEGPVFFSGSDSTGLVKTNVEEERIFSQQILGDEMKRPCNVFSRMLQISPNANLPHNTNFTAAAASTRGIKPPPFDTNDMIKTNNASCLVENSSMQIPLPRNPGIKRRKNQTKKVVCIPAPAAANNRSTGEVVPSDHWAWRKYGQKPIKGSPYPRGYYRCSSSKGCSARKQVERSRNDPNMLVITYTSEHNHPWPTQRNALAGSTRTQPVKKDAASKSSPSTETPKPRDLKEETEECDRDNTSVANEEPVIASGSSSTPLVTIKEEMKETEKSIMEMPNSQFNQDFGHHSVSNHSDDFFADLGELEPDPLELMFSQGFAEGKTEVQRENRDMDPFSIFDWSGNSFREAGKGL